MNNASLELGGTNWAEKDGNILGYSVGDTSGKYSPQEFTFSRGSNLSATRINKAGLIVKGRENLLLQSNQFDTTWTTNNASVSGGQTGYDGTNDAWLLEKSGGDGNIQNNYSFNGSVLTFSTYVKSGSTNWVMMFMGGRVGYFDLLNGIKGSFNGISSSIESVGNGWYKCSIVFNYNGASSVRIYPADANDDTTGTSGSIYIQDSQLEQGLAATPYIETTSTTAEAGVLENTPRLNYTTGVANPYLLLEPSRSNIFNNSEYFEGSGWALFGQSSLGSSFVQSPEGLSNAYTLNFGASNESLIYYNYTWSATFTTSVWARSDSGKKFCFRHWDGSEAVRSSDFTTTSEWQRFDYTFTSPIVNFGICNESSGGLGSIEIWGAQAEIGSYPTSYIPTYGTSATRAADSCSKTGASDVIGQTEGTIFWDVQIDTPVATANEALFNIDAGAFGNTVYLIKGGTGNITGEMYVSSAAQASFTLSGISAGNYKIAFAYAQNNTAMFVNGVQVGATDTSCNVPATSRIQLGNGVFGPSTDKTKQATLFKERLTNAELATLTTI